MSNYWSNYWIRLFGANVLACFFAPDPEPYWLSLAAYLFVVLGIMLVTEPAKPEQA